MSRVELDRFIDEHKEEMLQDLIELVKIDSIRGEALEGKPYGEGPAQVLDAAEKMMARYGFLTRNYENYVVTGDFSDKEKKLDILAHLDVVPVTENWKETEPFVPVIKGDRIYGRGTADDKGPAIAALYAMRAIRETGVELPYSVRLILGSDEECGSSDLAYYYSIEKEAPMSFTPDADFPVINLEKGRLHKTLTKKVEKAEESQVLSIKAGTKVNVVPDTAIAQIKGISLEKLNAVAAEMPESVSYLIEEKEDMIVITAKGLAAHASTPEAGHNAICGLLAYLKKLPFAASETTVTVNGLAELFPMDDFGGKALGIEMEDEISGKLTMNIGILNFDGENLFGEIDGRIPVCGNDENVTEVVRQAFAKYGIDINEGGMEPPHYVPADSELVQILMGCYEAYTGIKGEPLAIGGGTYVHHLERGVAFGCMTPEVDNHMHGDDEFMEISTLVMSAKIFADAIMKLCGAENE